MAHPTASPADYNDSDVDWSGGVLPKKRRVDAPVSQASPGMLESPVMCHRDVVEDILGDDGLESLDEEQKPSSSDGIVDENLRITSDEDNGDTQVTDATPSSSSTSITASSSKSPLTPSTCLNRMMTGSWTPSSATQVLQSLSGVSLMRTGRRIGIIRCIAGISFNADSDDVSGHAKKCKLNIDIAGMF